MNLFQTGNFILHSGDESYFKIEADALTYDDWETIAEIIHHHIAFQWVEGVPRGGLALENALWKYAQIDRDDLPLLIVDDVLSTGQSMEEQRRGRPAIGVVLFARGDVPIWVHALWQFMLPKRKK